MIKECCEAGKSEFVDENVVGKTKFINGDLKQVKENKKKSNYDELNWIPEGANLQWN